MNLKTLFKWIYKKGCNYNLFMLEENDYDNNHDIKDAAVVLKHQKYKTWLYVILLAVCLYMLFYVNLIQKESETVVISNITPDLFNELSSEHGQSLSCPCTTIIIPYKNFILNNVTMHSICSSVFVEQQWIEGLYFVNASVYGLWDFRTTAFSQFQLLSKFCSLSKEIISQTQIDINNTDFVTIELVSEMHVQQEVNDIIDFQKNDAFGQIILFMNYLNTTMQGNLLASALGTNWMVLTQSDITNNIYSLTLSGTAYTPSINDYLWCGIDNFIVPATLYSSSNDSTTYGPMNFLTAPIPDSTIVKGFFTGCTPLEAIFASTLDCLYEIECFQLLLNYFPNLNQLNITSNNSLLSSKHENISVLNYLNTLFIENWSVNINYSTYFDQCSPSMCTYITKDGVPLTYGITLFISLYGGLIIILRLVASSFIDIAFKCKTYSNNSNENLSHQNTNRFKSIETIKQLNLFKNIHNRTEQNIEQQRIITRIYLLILFGKVILIILSNMKQK